MNEKWYEVRVDYETVWTFAPSRLSRAEFVIDALLRDDSYRNKVLQILECEGWGSSNDAIQNALHTVVYESGGWEDTE